jgi:hypothetical protein
MVNPEAFPIQRDYILALNPVSLRESCPARRKRPLLQCLIRQTDCYDTPRERSAESFGTIASPPQDTRPEGVLVMLGAGNSQVEHPVTEMVLGTRRVPGSGGSEHHGNGRNAHPRPSREFRTRPASRSSENTMLHPAAPQSLARKQLAFGFVTLDVLRSATLRRSLQLDAQPGNLLGHPRIVRPVYFRPRIDE